MAPVCQNNEFHGFKFHSPTHSVPQTEMPVIGWTVKPDRTRLWGICGHGEKGGKSGLFFPFLNSRPVPGGHPQEHRRGRPPPVEYCMQRFSSALQKGSLLEVFQLPKISDTSPCDINGFAGAIRSRCSGPFFIRVITRRWQQ